MTKKERLQLLITGKTPKILEGFKAFDKGVAELKTQLEENVRIATLDEVSGKINEVKKSINLKPILDAVAQLKSDLEESDKQEKQELDSQLTTLKQQLFEAYSTNANNIKDLNDEIEGIETQIADILSRKPIELPDFSKQIRDSEMKVMTALNDYRKEEDTEDVQEAKDLEDKLTKLRIELLNRINERGGGNMNRQVLVGGADFLSKYTDYNIKAGSNMTITYVNDDTNKRVNLTFASSGGGGSVGGTVRQIQTVGVTSTIGTLAGTDQVYLCNAGIQLVLPTPVGDTNLYTIKNVSNSSILVVGTIDDDVNGVIMPVKYTSIDLISNDSSWDIT